MSMDCPKCEAKGSCLNSRRRVNSSVYRSYKCANEHRWSSVEWPLEVSDGPRPPGGGALLDQVYARLLVEAKAELRERVLEVLDPEPQDVVENA